MYDIAEVENFKRIDPDGAAGRITQAFHDLNDSIPVSVAARLLGLTTPDFKVNGKFHDGKPLPFRHHPRLRMYPWIKRPVAVRSEIEEMLDEQKSEGAL